MNYELVKLIVLDLDGTFLDNSGEIPYENLKTIKKINQYFPNVKIVIATGTGPNRAKKYAKVCESEYMICYNGAAVIKVMEKNILQEKNEVIIEKTIPIKKINDIIASAKEYKAEDLQIYDQDHEKILGISNIENMFKNKDIFLYKGLLIFSCDDKKINNIIKELTKKYPYFQISRSKLSKSHPYFKDNPNGRGIGIEINIKGTSKGEALSLLCKKLNIKAVEVMAFGDEINDKTMLEFAGESVAMGNANLELKTKFKTETNENSGVAKFLEKYFFSKELQIQNLNDEKYIFWDEFAVLSTNFEELFKKSNNETFQIKI